MPNLFLFLRQSQQLFSQSKSDESVDADSESDSKMCFLSFCFWLRYRQNLMNLLRADCKHDSKMCSLSFCFWLRYRQNLMNLLRADCKHDSKMCSLKFCFWLRKTFVIKYGVKIIWIHLTAIFTFSDIVLIRCVFWSYF